MFHSDKGEEGKHAYHSALEEKLNEIFLPFQQYIKSQATASIFLFICTIAALIWASVPSIAGFYDQFINITLGFHFAGFTFDQPLRFWVNDILLTLFFFFVGLEIKREFLVGELTNHKQALFVLIAAIGGMTVPALIYFFTNVHTANEQGWGIPMATDTAFALGMLTCFRRRIPKGIFTFLAALAIIDDIGAIIYVAIFYSDNLDWFLILVAFLLVGLLALLNYAGIRKPLPYILVGIFIWIATEFGGIHGTLAGILVAFLIPARPGKGPKQFIRKIKTLLNYFEERKNKVPLVLQDKEQHAVLEEVQEMALQATTPLQRWEGRLELPVSLIILPLFALVNAGIPIDVNLIGNVFVHRVSLGILLGLVIGKPLGVILFSRLAYWCRLGKWPQDTRFSQIASASLLTGIGFTMSLFIADLSFNSENLLLMSKAAILLASAISAVVGIFFLLKTR